jgi:hypothetical protein
MKLVKTFKANDEDKTVKIKIEFEQKAGIFLNGKDEVANKFENIVDDLWSKVMLEYFHASAIKIVKA